MDVPIGSSVAAVKVAVMQAAADSEKRRLSMLPRDRCVPGCHSCCHRTVEVTVAEATVVVDHLRRAGSWKPVRKACEELAERARTVSPDAWFKMKTRCPVLADDGRCSAYAVRPPACSVHFVTSDPSLCDPWSSSAGEYSPVELRDVYALSQERIREALPDGGIMTMVLPLPIALLLADRVAVRTDLSYEQAIELIGRET